MLCRVLVVCLCFNTLSGTVYASETDNSSQLEYSNTSNVKVLKDGIYINGTYYTKEQFNKLLEKAIPIEAESDLDKIVIAYEPIWAIGTGKTATSEDAQNAIKAIREKIKSLFNTDDISILYGGSVKGSNAKELFAMKDIDGGLVGGASLEAKSFAEIVNFDK